VREEDCLNFMEVQVGLVECQGRVRIL
jgi:hypothetical protein